MPKKKELKLLIIIIKLEEDILFFLKQHSYYLILIQILLADSAKAVISKLYNFNEKDHSSPIVNAAIILTLQKFYNFRFNVNVLYNYLLKNYSYWFHQLFAESLGKNKL